MGSTAKNYQDLITRAQSVLTGNSEQLFTVPSKGLYPHQVLWDGCFVAIGMSHYDLDQAKYEIGRILSSQWSNGMIPHIIFTEGPRYWWDRRIWRSWVSPLAPKKLATSGVSQPPVLAEAIVAVGKQLSETERISWYQSVFAKLVDYHLWLVNERDLSGEGLLVQLHPWETGLDNSPPCMVELRAKGLPWWIKFLEVTNLEKIGDHFRVDTKYVSKGERSSNIEALANYNLLRKIRRLKYDSQKILAKPSFAIVDVTYNCVFMRANDLLIEIAKSLGENLPKSLQEFSAKAHDSLETLWDEGTSQYYCRGLVSGGLIKEPSIAALLPLYSGKISQKRAEQLVELLETNNGFNLNYPVPTVAGDSPWFNSRRYWQGPTWVNTNWLIIHGLRRYGFNQQAEKLTLSTLALVNKSGFYEYFDPSSGEPSGVNNFSWTAALVIDLASRVSSKS